MITLEFYYDTERMERTEQEEQFMGDIGVNKQEERQGSQYSKRNVNKHKHATLAKGKRVQHYRVSPLNPPNTVKDIGQNEWIRLAEEIKIEEVGPEQSDASELGQEELLKLAEEIESEQSDASELGQEELLRQVAEIDADQADTSKYSDNKKIYLEEETLSVPYAYARKIYVKGLYRCLDSPDDNDQIYCFNGRYWKPMSDNQLRAIAYQEISEDDRRNEKSIDSYLNQIVSYLKWECISAYQEGQRFTERDFRKIQNRIVFRNCVYDAKKGRVLKFDSKLPYYFGVDADYVEDDMPTYYYDKLRTDATDGDEESIKMFDYALGYLLIPNRTGKCLIVMADARDSGKSILGEFFGNLIEGERTITIDPEHLAGRFAHGRASQAILYSCLEMNTGKLSQVEVRELKKITGDTVIRAERKYKNEQNVKIRMKLLLATNTGLILDDTVQDDAFFRRVVVLPFIRSTPLDELIADLPERLAKEKNYIVSRAVRSLKDIIQEDGGTVFPESELSRTMKESWARITHYEDAFMDKCLLITGKESDAVLKDDIYDIYMLFCERSKLRTGGMVCGRNKLMEKIQRRYPQVADTKLRRDSILCPKGKPMSKPCLAGVQINLDYLKSMK